MLDLTKPMQNEFKQRVNYLGRSMINKKYPLVFERIELGYEQQIFCVNEKGEDYLGSSLSNIPALKLEIKVDCFYWTKTKQIVKIVFERQKLYHKFVGINVFDESYSAFGWKNDGAYYNEQSGHNDITHQLTPEEVAEHVYSKKPKPKTTGLTREEMLKAIDEGKAVKRCGSKYMIASNKDACFHKDTLWEIVE